MTLRVYLLFVFLATANSVGKQATDEEFLKFLKHIEMQADRTQESESVGYPTNCTFHDQEEKGISASRTFKCHCLGKLCNNDYKEMIKNLLHERYGRKNNNRANREHILHKHHHHSHVSAKNH